MKVEQVRQFDPIKITLETKDEATLLIELIQERLQCSTTAQARLASELLEKINRLL